MKRKFAAFDIDGTIFRSSLVAELLLLGIQRGVFQQSAYGEFSTQYENWRRRKDDAAYDIFIEALVASYVKHIKGQKSQHIDILAESVIDGMSDYTHVYTRKLSEKLKGDGYFLIAISGSPSELVSRFTTKYGFDAFVAAEYTLESGMYTGASVPAHSGKDKILTQLVEQHDLDWAGSYAVGDSPGDIGMLSLVENPIAFNPDRILLQKAQQEHWRVVVERKNVVYEMESVDGRYVLATSGN